MCGCHRLQIFLEGKVCEVLGEAVEVEWKGGRSGRVIVDAELMGHGKAHLPDTVKSKVRL